MGEDVDTKRIAQLRMNVWMEVAAHIDGCKGTTSTPCPNMHQSLFHKRRENQENSRSCITTTWALAAPHEPHAGS